MVLGRIEEKLIHTHIGESTFRFLRQLPEEAIVILGATIQVWVVVTWITAIAIAFTPLRHRSMTQRAAIAASVAWIVSSVTNIWFYFGWFK